MLGYHRKKEFINGTFIRQDFKSLSIFYITIYGRFFPKQDLNIIPVKYGLVKYNNYEKTSNNPIYCFKENNGQVEQILRKARYKNQGIIEKPIKYINNLFLQARFSDCGITQTTMINNLTRKINGLHEKTNLNNVIEKINLIYKDMAYINDKKKFLLSLYTFAVKRSNNFK